MDKLSGKAFLCVGLLALAGGLHASPSRVEQAVPAGLLILDGDGRLTLPESAISPGADSVTVKSATRRGAPLHYALSQVSGPVGAADVLFVEITRLDSFRFDGAKAGSPEYGTLSDGIVVPDDPNPPNQPGVPGLTTSSTTCGIVQKGVTYFPATIVYQYEYRYTRDSNRDGVMDSDPEWKLVGFIIKELTTAAAALCE